MKKPRFYAVTVVKFGPDDNTSMHVVTSLTEANSLAATGRVYCIEEILEFGKTRFISGDETLTINFYNRELEDED